MFSFCLPQVFGEYHVKICTERMELKGTQQLKEAHDEYLYRKKNYLQDDS
jgi:hypothetical protein